MRGYDALDPHRRQPPGRRAGDALRDGGRRGRGRRPASRTARSQPARHGPADRAALRQDARRVAGQGRRHRLRARGRRGDGPRPERRGRGGGRAARRPRPRDDRGAPPDAAYAQDERCTSCRSASAIVNTVVKHADGRHVTVGARCASGALRQVVPDTLEFYFGLRRRRAPSARARGWSRSSSPPGCAARACEREWELDAAGIPLPHLRGRGRGRRRRQRVRGRVDRGRGGRMHRTKVKVVEEALDANNTIAHGEPGRLRPRRGAGRELHERARGGQDVAARARAGRPRGRPRRGARGRRAGQHGRRPPRPSATSR